MHAGGSDGKESARNAGDQVQSLDWEDPLEKRMATHSRILAWRIPWTEEPGGPQSTWPQRVGHNRSNLTHTTNLKAETAIQEWRTSQQTDYPDRKSRRK